jgi:hypothetical protein
MESHRISESEKAALTDSACHLFVARNPDYWPCAANSEKLLSFVQQQLGQSLDEFPYPVLVDQWQAAYEHIKKTSWFYERPSEPEVIDEAAAEEARKQQAVRDNHDAQQRAAKIARDKAMPLSDLRKVVGVQNVQFREQREQNLLPVRSTGMESRAVSTVTVGPKAQARVNVGLQNPGLDTHSVEFTRLYALELQRLRNQ